MAAITAMQPSRGHAIVVGRSKRLIFRKLAGKSLYQLDRDLLSDPKPLAAKVPSAQLAMEPLFERAGVARRDRYLMCYVQHIRAAGLQAGKAFTQVARHADLEEIAARANEINGRCRMSLIHRARQW